MLQLFDQAGSFFFDVASLPCRRERTVLPLHILVQRPCGLSVLFVISYPLLRERAGGTSAVPLGPRDTATECYLGAPSLARLGLAPESWIWISRASVGGPASSPQKARKHHLVRVLVKPPCDVAPPSHSGDGEHCGGLLDTDSRQSKTQGVPQDQIFLSAHIMHFLELTSGRSVVEIQQFTPTARGKSGEAEGDRAP